MNHWGARYAFPPFDTLLDRWCKLEMSTGNQVISGKVHHCDTDGRVYLKRADSTCGAKSMYLSTAIVPADDIRVVEEISPPDWAESDDSLESSDEESTPKTDDDFTDDMEAIIVPGPRLLQPSHGYVHAPTEGQVPGNALEEIPGGAKVEDSDVSCVSDEDQDENGLGDDGAEKDEGTNDDGSRKRKGDAMTSDGAKAARYDDPDNWE